MKQIKTENVEQFLARGGKVVKLYTKEPFKKRSKTYKKEEEFDEFDEYIMDFSALPEALKIKYGVR